MNDTKNEQAGFARRTASAVGARVRRSARERFDRFRASREYQIFARLFRYFLPYKIWVAVALGFALVVSTADGAVPAYLVQPIMDKIFANPDKTTAYAWLRMMPFLIVAVFVGKGVLRFLHNYIICVIGQRVIRQVRGQLYEHYQQLSIDYYTDTNTGVMMSRITNDVNMMERAVPALTSMIRDPFGVLGLAVVAVVMWWKMAVIVIVITALTAYPIQLFGRKVRKYTGRGQTFMGLMNTILKENFSGIRVIKAFGMEKYEIERFRKENERVYGANVARVKYDELTAPAIEALGAIALSAVVVFGGAQVLSGVITTGRFFSFVAAVLLMYEPLKRTARMYTAFQSAIGAAERVFDVLDTSATIADRPGAAELPPIRDRIDFEHVQFCYHGSPDIVLHDFNLEVRAGQTIAIVGGSGSGKTTLINLIPRFYDPTGGRILIDGVDLRDVTMTSLRRQIAMVTQDTFLFDDTVRKNIAYGRGDADLARIVDAAKMAYAHDFIMSFPKGYDTDIGELGVKLSGGQRQRLAIARALFKNAPILILDEATSSLDTESEREVQLALENLMQGRTTFVIAHRLSTIRRADRIIALRDGRIVEDGAHDELLARRGEYARLYNMQFRTDD
jgi:subfamily B ATP-binding cassette protein MsbA